MGKKSGVRRFCFELQICSSWFCSKVNLTMQVFGFGNDLQPVYTWSPRTSDHVFYDYRSSCIRSLWLRFGRSACFHNHDA